MECKPVTAAEFVIHDSSHADVHFPILLRFLGDCRVFFSSCRYFGFFRQTIGPLQAVLAYVSGLTTFIESVVTEVLQFFIAVYIRAFFNCHVCEVQILLAGFGTSPVPLVVNEVVKC